MGGFVAIEEGSPTTGSNTEPEQHELKDKDAPRPDAHPKVENSEAAAQSEKLGENEHIVGGKLPDITTAEIHGKSKGNIFVKAIAVVQAFWVSVQVIVPAVKGLATSQLELAVTAFSVCAIITYNVLIPRPQGVQVPSRPIRCDPTSPERAFMEDVELYFRTMLVPGMDRYKLSRNYSSRRRTRVANDYVNNDEVSSFYVYIGGMILGGIIFGSIYVAGWNLEFATPIKQKLWRIASILMTCLLPVVFTPTLLINSSISLFEFLDDPLWLILLQSWGFVFRVIYIAARLFTFLEIFRTLLYLPLDAYIST